MISILTNSLWNLFIYWNIKFKPAFLLRTYQKLNDEPQYCEFDQEKREGNLPIGGLLRYRKWVPQQLGDVIKQESGDSRPMGARHSNMAANHNFTHFLVWSTRPLLIFFCRPDGKLFLSFLPILLCSASDLYD